METVHVISLVAMEILMKRATNIHNSSGRNWNGFQDLE